MRYEALAHCLMLLLLWVVQIVLRSLTVVYIVHWKTVLRVCVYSHHWHLRLGLHLGLIVWLNITAVQLHR